MGQKPDSRVLTTKGWIRVDNLQEGMLVVTPTGSRTAIINIYKQPLLSIYELRTSNNNKVFYGSPNQRLKTKRTVTVGTNILESLYTVKSMGTVRNTISTQHEIENIKVPLDFDDNYSEFSSYVFGILLTYICNNPTNWDYIISCPKESLATRIVKELNRIDPNIKSEFIAGDNLIKLTPLIINKAKEQIIQILEDCYSTKENNTNEYLYTSIAKRIDLLRGIFALPNYSTYDNNTQSTQYTTENFKICKVIKELVKGLGGEAIISTKVVEGINYFVVTIYLKSINPFLLSFTDINYIGIDNPISIIKSGTSYTYRVIDLEITQLDLTDPTNEYIGDDFTILLDYYN